MKIIISHWKWCYASSHSISPSKKQKPKWFPKWIPSSILGSAIKFEHALCLYVFHCTFHAGCIFQHTLVTYPYQSVITFGGYRDDFMVVTSHQTEPGVGKKSAEKLVFAMAKPKVCLLHLLSWVFTSWVKFSVCLHMWVCHLSFLRIQHGASHCSAVLLLLPEKRWKVCKAHRKKSLE